jgi:hypothetical protein
MAKRKNKTSVDVVSLAVPNFPKEQSPVDNIRQNFQRFGSDNLFPQAISLINRQGTTHRAILNNKTTYISGKGFTVDESNVVLAEYIKRVNNNAESLKSIFRKLAFDFNAYGNAWIEVVTNGSRDFVSLFHQHSPRVRYSKDGSMILLHPDWSKYNQSKSLVKSVGLYPEFLPGDDGFNHSIIHVKDYEPEFTFYGLPKWLSAMDSASIGYKTNKWNVSRLENQFSPSAILEIYGNPDDEEIKKGKEALKREHTNRDVEGRNSKLIVITKEEGGEASKYTPLIQTQEGDWIDLHKQSDQDLIIAHNWFRSLTGIGEPGQLGNTQQIRNEYQIAQATVISEVQELIMDNIKMVLENEGGFDVDTLEVRNKPPIDFVDKLTLDMVITKGEARKMVGLMVDENDPRMDEMIATEPKKNQDGIVD